MKLAVLPFIVMAICCGCQTKASRAEVRHVLIAYPEHWTDGERRACFLGPPGDSTVRGSVGQLDLPELDCDRFVKGELIHYTPQERIYALDVVFTASIEKALASREGYVEKATAWTCQQKADVITCAP